MRTVTFADPALADWLNRSFVCVWFNHAPDFLIGEAPDGQPQPVFSPEEVAAYPEGGGGGNIRSYFCAPDGAVRHATQGWWSSAAYRADAERALDFVKDGATVRDVLVARRAAAAALDAEAADVEKANPGELGKPIADSAPLRRIAALRLLAKSYRDHEALVGQPVRPILDRTVEENREGSEFS